MSPRNMLMSSRNSRLGFRSCLLSQSRVGWSNWKSSHFFRQMVSDAECSCEMTAPDRDKHDHFLRLYVENEEALRGFVRSLVPTLEDAREVMQETAALLWRKFDELDSQDNFRRWAFGVARLEALTFRRDQARDRHVFSEDLMRLLEAEAEEAAGQSDHEERALERCLQKLPQAQRTLIETVYVGGARIDEMARDSGRTPMALYKLLHRVRMALADCVRMTLAAEEGVA